MQRVYKSKAYRTDSLMRALSWGTFLLVVMLFGLIVGDILWNGISQLKMSFFLSAPENAGRAGGVAPMIVSTVMILLVCLGISLPLGLGTAILLSEFSREKPVYSNLVRRSLDILAGVPSIVFGLFGNALFAKALGLGFSILSGGLTLACMVLPILIRSVEEGLRGVPDDLRMVSASLGLSKWTSIKEIILPLAVPSVIVGTVLGIGRAVAETAALIFTSGYVDRMPESIMDSGRALSVHIYDLAMNVPGGNSNAYGASLVLLILLIISYKTTAFFFNRYLGNKVQSKG